MPRPNEKIQPWVLRNGKLFTKADFKLNMRDMTITCPGGAVEQIDLGAFQKRGGLAYLYEIAR